MVTDQDTTRAAELTRGEAMMHLLKDELPYNVQVVTEVFKPLRRGRYRIQAGDTGGDSPPSGDGGWASRATWCGGIGLRARLGHSGSDGYGLRSVPARVGRQKGHAGLIAPPAWLFYLNVCHGRLSLPLPR
jgi:hypothetical protein